MIEKCRVILLSEINSKLGSPFLRILSAHPMIELLGVVTSPSGTTCSYFVHDEVTVDLEVEGRGLSVPVYRPERVNQSGFVAHVRSLRPDYLIVANFQQKIGSELLSVPRVMALNFHPSPLPEYAGLAPFYWMVRNGERESAVSVIEMDEGLDTGPIVMQRRLTIFNSDTGLSLRTRQERHNVLLLLDLIPHLTSNNIPRVSQDALKRSYFSRPGDGDHLIDFERDARTVQNQVRAAYRHPGAYCKLPDGSELRILSVALMDGGDLADATRPGSFIRTPNSMFVRAADQWLQILTIDVDGEEISPSKVQLEGVPIKSEVSSDSNSKISHSTRLMELSGSLSINPFLGHHDDRLSRKR